MLQQLIRRKSSLRPRSNVFFACFVLINVIENVYLSSSAILLSSILTDLKPQIRWNNSRMRKHLTAVFILATFLTLALYWCVN